MGPQSSSGCPAPRPVLLQARIRFIRRSCVTSPPVKQKGEPDYSQACQPACSMDDEPALFLNSGRRWITERTLCHDRAAWQRRPRLLIPSPRSVRRYDRKVVRWLRRNSAMRRSTTSSSAPQCAGHRSATRLRLRARTAAQPHVHRAGYTVLEVAKRRQRRLDAPCRLSHPLGRSSEYGSFFIYADDEFRLNRAKTQLVPAIMITSRCRGQASRAVPCLLHGPTGRPKNYRLMINTSKIH